MNDPFECLAIVPRQYDKQKIENFKIKALNTGSEQWKLMAGLRDEAIVEFLNQLRQEFIQNYYFFGSLSESYDNILLWSHYAASHTGFVLAIDFDENDNHIQKVFYQNTLPDFDNDWYFSLQNSDDTNSQTISYLLKDFAIKSTNWSYENEWRVSRKGEGYFTFKPEQVKAVYYGLNCNVDTVKILTMLLAYIPDDTPIYQMALLTNPLMMIVKDYEFPDE